MVVLVSCNILYLKGFLKWGTPRAGLLISWKIHLYMDENWGYHHSRNLDLMDMRNVSTFRSFGQCTRQANQSCVRHCKTLIFMCFCAGSCRTFGARFFSLLVTATIHEQRFQHSIKCKCTLLPHPSTPTAPTKQPCVHVFHILVSSIFYDSVS